MFSTTYFFGMDNGKIDAICLEHINNQMLMFVKTHQEFWRDLRESGDKETFGTYLKDVCPKCMVSKKDRTNLYKSLVEALSSPDFEELTIEQEYMLFHIMDEYMDYAEDGLIEYRAEKISEVEEDSHFTSKCLYPNIWFIADEEKRNLVIAAMHERAEEIFLDCEEDFSLGENVTKENRIDLIFQDLMAAVEDVSTYRQLLDDTDFEMYDEIPWICAI